jgi:hypothetical protein
VRTGQLAAVITRLPHSAAVGLRSFVFGLHAPDDAANVARPAGNSRSRSRRTRYLACSRRSVGFSPHQDAANVVVKIGRRFEIDPPAARVFPRFFHWELGRATPSDA